MKFNHSILSITSLIVHTAILIGPNFLSQQAHAQATADDFCSRNKDIFKDSTECSILLLAGSVEQKACLSIIKEKQREVLQAKVQSDEKCIHTISEVDSKISTEELSLHITSLQACLEPKIKVKPENESDPKILQGCVNEINETNAGFKELHSKIRNAVKEMTFLEYLKNKNASCDKNQFEKLNIRELDIPYANTAKDLTLEAYTQASFYKWTNVSGEFQLSYAGKLIQEIKDLKADFKEKQKCGKFETQATSESLEKNLPTQSESKPNTTENATARIAL